MFFLMIKMNILQLDVRKDQALWDEDEICGDLSLWPAGSCCGHRLKFRTWGGGKSKVVQLFFCQIFLEYRWQMECVKAARVCDRGSCAAQAAATIYTELPLFRNKRHQVPSVAWVTWVLCFSNSKLISVHCIFNYLFLLIKLINISNLISVN